MAEQKPVPALSAWLLAATAETFPYDVVVGEYQRVGKHFVSKDLLDPLHRVRTRLAQVTGSGEAVGRLARFLDVVLDKRDERYDYRTYLALSLLPLPSSDRVPGTADAAAQRQHDRLLVQLMADTVRFELEALDGTGTLLPRMRPDTQTTLKRFRLALRAAQPALGRLGVTGVAADLGPDLISAARDWSAAVLADMSAAEWWALRQSMLPVWVIHDEYMFIRVLQTFETTFALLTLELTTAIAALREGQPDVAAEVVASAEHSLSQVSRVFSLLATMQVESFREFRQYTEGASAIQSRNYKIVESLCASPAQVRLDSPAYMSVPDLRERLLDGQPSLDDLARAGKRAGWFSPAAQAELTAAMKRFEGTLMQWRQTHYRLAVRMLGDRTGTGYTEGTPYLKKVRSIRVFSNLRPG